MIEKYNIENCHNCFAVVEYIEHINLQGKVFRVDYINNGYMMTYNNTKVCYYCGFGSLELELAQYR